MKTRKILFSVIGIVVLITMLVGCAPAPAPTEAPAASPAAPAAQKPQRHRSGSRETQDWHILLRFRDRALEK